MAMTLKNVRYFIAIAEAGSITTATKSLNVSQSVLTEALKVLETDMGTPLFTRRARGMELTHAGYQFLHHASRILSTVEEARHAIARGSQGVKGTLNIGVSSLVTAYYLPALLENFRRLYPNVTVTLAEDRRPFIEHLLVNGELDIAVLLVSNLEDRQALEAEPLVVSPWRLWLSVDQKLTRKTRVSLNELADSELVIVQLDELEETTSGYWRELQVRPRIAARTASIEAARSLVARGIGVSILPGIFYRPWSLEGGRLEWRPIEEDLSSVQVGITWRRGSALSEPAQSFLALAREHAGTLQTV